jgi:putative membrane protein
MKCRRLIPILLIASPLAAHTTDELVTRDELWHAWSFEPGVIALLIVSGLVFAVGLRNSRGSACPRWRQILFWLGLFVLGISQISPLHRLGSVLFSAHMVQHELLMLVAAPLLVLSQPLATFLWAFPIDWRVSLGRLAKQQWFSSIWQKISSPLAAWLIHAIALWTWHIPMLFEATLRSEWIHAGQHLSFFGSALLFWWALVHTERAQNFGSSFLYIFTTAIHSGALGALLTFAPSVLYSVYEGRTIAWGLSAIEDQQLGGLIMWVPSSLVFLGIGLWLFAKWMRESEHRVMLSRF